MGSGAGEVRVREGRLTECRALRLQQQRAKPFAAALTIDSSNITTRSNAHSPHSARTMHSLDSNCH